MANRCSAPEHTGHSATLRQQNSGSPNGIYLEVEGSLALDIGRQHEAAGHFPALLDGLFLLQDLGSESIFDGSAWDARGA